MILVINMNKYKIVKVKKEFNELCNTYPSIVKFLFNETKEQYFENTIKNIFEPINKELILSIFNGHIVYDSQLDEYMLYNDIKKNYIIIRFFEYFIDVEEINDEFVLFSNLKEKISSFYLIQ